jgi:hypothetical protein
MIEDLPSSKPSKKQKLCQHGIRSYQAGHRLPIIFANKGRTN